MGFDSYPLREIVIDFSASGDNTVIPGTPNNVIRVFRLFLVVDGTTTLTFKDGAGTALSGAMYMTTGGAIVFDYTEVPWFSVSLGNDFVINSTVAVGVKGRVYYTQHGV